MIFPILRGILSFKEAPVTWALFVINFFVAVITVGHFVVGQKVIDEILSDKFFLEAQGRFYAQYVTYHEKVYTAKTLELVRLALSGNKEKLEILGSLAIRDKLFFEQAESFSFTGDQVALEWWRKKLKRVKAVHDVHPNYVLGVESSESPILTWVTYQFVHSGMMHFAGNMIFLLIFGSMLEPIIGGMALLIVYLISGMLAAGSFLFLTGISSIPLIGASGSVSGIMALFCVYFWQRSVRYIFFLFVPKRGYAGYIYLPGWVAFVMWLLSDLAGYMGTSDEFGGIAHAAHLGGEAAGALAALLIILIRYYFKRELITADKIPLTKPLWTRVT